MKERILKPIALISVFAVMIGLVLASPAVAGKPPKDPPPPDPTKHEVVVSQDGDGDFTTITDALASITDVSDTNRYLVTVKPGLYVEDVVQMKSYVNLQGSGPD